MTEKEWDAIVEELKQKHKEEAEQTDKKLEL